MEFNQETIVQKQFLNMDRNALLNLVIEKEKRIQDLEQLVEDQKRLRLQDSSQVEEKAAKIKEWVTNKLKELENQNRQLRDQNKRQKETVDTLTNKLAAMSPISSPRKRNTTLDKVQYIDCPSPIETIDVNKSLKSRRPQLKKLITTSSSLSENENENILIEMDTSSLSKCQIRLDKNFTDKQEIAFNSVDLSIVPINSKSKNCQEIRQESPLYDSVNNEHLLNQACHTNYDNRIIKQNEIDTFNATAHYEVSKSEHKPPPPPPHKFKSLKSQYYSNICSEKTKFSEINGNENDNQDIDSSRSQEIYDCEFETLRKSSSSLKNGLKSLVNPSFTTIDGDPVVEDVNFHRIDSEVNSNDLTKLGTPVRRCYSNEQSSQSSSYPNRPRNDSLNSIESADRNVGQNLFDSPMRCRSGKDSILRTQSVKKNPTPQRLYDFISADLVKRGYLVKSGALKNHNRWFVLKNFTLFLYKKEQDETAKTTPMMTLKLDSTFQIHHVNQSNESSFPFKLSYSDKTLQLIADTAQTRDEWIKILTVTINLSDIEPDTLTKQNSIYEGILSVTRHCHTKRCYGILVSHVVFFLKSITDPTPTSYVSVKESKIREITDTNDYDHSEQELMKKDNSQQDCGLAIYPKYSVSPDPIYLKLGSQQDIDGWLFFLSLASGIDQSYGTQFERSLTRLMVDSSMASRKIMANPNGPSSMVSECLWRNQFILLYSESPITQPLTSLPNETLQSEAIELFKSILLFTQVAIEPIAIDYHVSLLQNCLGRFLKYPELRNEFYAQLIKQCTYVVHRCSSSKLSSSSSGCSSINQRSSTNSLSQNSGECHFVTDIQSLELLTTGRSFRSDVNSTLSRLSNSREKSDFMNQDESNPPTQSELLQVMQILAVAVSLNLPRGRLRCWLLEHLQKFSNPESGIGKYALYTLRAIERTTTNGTRENVPSRTEIMSILLRNPHDHSRPHSIPLNFPDGSHLVVEADGSTTVEEFMLTMSKSVNIRHSQLSDFYIFADDPTGSQELHILEAQRKVLDVVGWWEQVFRQNNSGRYQNTKFIKLTCKKRLVLRKEENETEHEKLLIMHQVRQEMNSKSPAHKN